MTKKGRAPSSAPATPAKSRGRKPRPGGASRSAAPGEGAGREHEAAATLRASELRYRRLFETARDGILILDGDTGSVVDANPFLTEGLGYTLEELLGKKLWELGAFTDIEASKRAFAELERRGYVRYEDLQLKAKDGRLLDVEFISNVYDVDGARVYQCNIRDISERKRSENELRASQQLIEGILNAIPVRVFWKDRNLVYLGCNMTFAHDAGLSDPKDLIGKDDFQMVWRDQAELYRRDDAEVIETGRSRFLIEEPQTTPDGRTITLLTSKVPLRSATGEVTGMLGSYLDISEQKESARTLLKLNRVLRTVSAGNSAVLRATSEEQLLKRMCEAVVNSGGYIMAWAGYAEADAAKTVRPVAWAGDGADYVQNAYITWSEDDEHGGGPAGRSIRTGTPQVARRIDTDPSMAPWHTAARRQGYQSSLSVPIRGTSDVLGALMIYSQEPDSFDAEEQALLSGMCADLSYGITALRTRVAHDAAIRQLEKSLGATVQSLARTVELRDPYTAGHQRRVADICAEIAREMALDENRTSGLILAAGIHDIGKISIPAEILSKPSELTAVEFNLLKSHPESGYEILRDVDFPWPVADMVRQHHERLDGSGYPHGLKSGQILLEAKILAVADVVEAMLSYRPLRPASTLDVTLDAITRGRGIVFDTNVVDACLRVFRENGYELAAR